MKKRLLIVLPHCSTGGGPQYSYKKIQVLRFLYDIYVVEYQNFSNDYIVQRTKIQNIIDNYEILGDNKYRLLEIIEQFKPDYIHFEEIIELFHGNEIYDIITKITKLENRPYIFETTHSSKKQENKFLIPDGFSFVSDLNKTQYSDLNIPTVISEYPTEKQIRPQRHKSLIDLNLNPNYIHIVNVGIFTPGKNQSEIFEYAKLLQDEKVQFHFVGLQAENFKEYWEPLLNDIPKNCKLWGQQDNTYKFLLSMDLHLFTSKLENNPLVVKEAIECDIPQFIYNLPVYSNKFDKFSNIYYLTNDFNENLTKLKNFIELKKSSLRIK